MRTSLLIAAIVTLLPTLVFAQSASDIERKYEKTVDVYSASERVWMTPEYDAEGQVCLMRLYAKRVSKDTNYLDDSLPMDEVLKILDELVPVPNRGARRDGFGDGSITISGGIAWMNFDYERVTFTFVSSFGVIQDLKAGEHLNLDFPIDPDFEKKWREEQRKLALTPDNELMRRRVLNARVLEVRWLTRKCAR